MIKQLNVLFILISFENLALRLFCNELNKRKQDHNKCELEENFTITFGDFPTHCIHQYNVTCDS